MTTKKEEKMAENLDKQTKKQKHKKHSEVDILKEKNNELLKTVQYVQAEFQNYKNRVERDRQEHAQFANKDLILNLLPVIDNFELAIKSANDHKKDKQIDSEFLKGMELIYSQLLDILKKEGLKQIDTFNEDFDPYKHECLMQEESDKKSNTIIEEFQKGYFLKDKVIRHAKVKVAK